ncbi:MAG: antibiotic biosynthesis monooxygenase [Acidimicrobiia bacterium]|nr:antibiotic biosynthesis monooxygenase [Acidimicrobiia bacterium]
MLILSGTVKMNPDDIAVIKDAALTMIAATRAEDGCIEYEFSEVIGEPGTMRIFERWESVDALKAHFVAPHMAVWQDALKGATVHERDLARYEGITDIIPL